MKTTLFVHLVAFSIFSLALLPATAFARPSTEAQTDRVTDARTEQMQFSQNLDQARRALQTGEYDLAQKHSNAAKSWFLAFADSVALEKPGVSWDAVRVLEANLIETYSELGRLYHLSGQFQSEINVLGQTLALNPYQPEAFYQQELASKALSDANDLEKGIERKNLN